MLHNSTYQNFTSFHTQNWLHSMFAAAHNLVKGRREIEDQASIFISNQLRYHVEILTNIVVLKKTSARSLRLFCWYVCPTSLTIINKKYSRRWQNYGHSKVSTLVKAAETIKTWKLRWCKNNEICLVFEISISHYKENRKLGNLERFFFYFTFWQYRKLKIHKIKNNRWQIKLKLVAE